MQIIHSLLIANLAKLLRGFGRRMIERLWRLGAAARLFFLTIVYSGESFRRFHLTLREIYFTVVMSLLIIIVSAFFVGMVLGLQGYNTLQKYGSSEAIGVLVALSYDIPSPDKNSSFLLLITAAATARNRGNRIMNSRDLFQNFS